MATFNKRTFEDVPRAQSETGNDPVSESDDFKSVAENGKREPQDEVPIPASPEPQEQPSIANTAEPGRLTRPLPAPKARRLPVNPNPSFLPIQASIPRTLAEKQKTRRLIVILEQSCLEAYKVSSGSASKAAKDGKDAKYALLNCDDHQGILAKTGRDIADARPDITHQVDSSASLFLILTYLDLHEVSSYASRLSVKQSRPIASLHTHHKGCANRG